MGYKVDNAYITELCYSYAAGDTSKGNDIYSYCHRLYFNVIHTLQAEREDLFQEIMLEIFERGIERYLRIKDRTTFEAFFMMTASNKALTLSNPYLDRNVVYMYSQIQKISTKYNIPISISNAHKFSKILRRNDRFTINKCIYAIEGYCKVVSLENVKNGRFN